MNMFKNVDVEKLHLRLRSKNINQKKKKIFFLIIIGIFLLSALIISQHNYFRAIVINLFPKTAKNKQQFLSILGKKDLNQQLNTIFNQHSQISISVAFIDLDNDTIMNIGESQAFKGASTTKLITAIYFLHQVELGNASLNEMIGVQTAKWQLQQMIQQSNNDSWALLNHNLGYQNLNNYAHQIGLSSFDFDTNNIPASDEVLLLQELYNGQLLNQTHTDLLLSFMQDTNNEDLIPAALPSETTVYHKYGILDNNVHDVAIIKHNNKSFAIAIFTNSNDPVNYQQRTELFHKITQIILAIF
jgi:beta-lactamase class A